MGIKFTPKILKSNVVFVAMFFVAVSASADTANIPNTFVSGHTAVAQDVNDNFTALKSAIDGNAGRLPILKDADGIIKGTLITYLSVNITLMSEKTYIFNVHSLTGEFINNYLYFESDDCSGLAYATNSQSVQTDGTRYHYVPKGSPLVSINANSSSMGYSCDTFDTTVTKQVYPALENDPAITGVESAPLALPFTIETL